MKKEPFSFRVWSFFNTTLHLLLQFFVFRSASTSKKICFLFHPSVPATLLLHTKRVLRLPLLCFLVQKQRKREDNNILCYSASASVFASSISALSRVSISIVQLTSALLSPSSVTLWQEHQTPLFSVFIAWYTHWVRKNSLKSTSSSSYTSRLQLPSITHQTQPSSHP